MCQLAQAFGAVLFSVAVAVIVMVWNIFKVDRLLDDVYKLRSEVFNLRLKIIRGETKGS